MGKIIPSLLLITLLTTGPFCQAQTSVRVSDPRLEFRDNRLYISYDILDSDPDERYVVSVDIRDEAGNAVDANALTGDIGILDEGGSDKRIIWDLGADNVLLDAYVHVQVNAEVISGQPAGPPSSEKSKRYSRAGIVVQSLAVPGLGLSRVTGKPHWLRAVAGYGLVAGSIAWNRMAVSTYNEIEDLDRFDDIRAAYDNSSRQDNTSELLGYAAIGVWVADLIWTIAGSSDLNRKSSYVSEGTVSFRSGIDPVSAAPMVGITYRF